jgi:hypothetical protein
MFGIAFKVGRARGKYQIKTLRAYGIFNQYIKGSL